MIYAMYLHYYVEPREAETFDSGPIELSKGGFGIAEITQAAVEISTRGAVVPSLYTDLPEGQLTIGIVPHIAAADKKRTVILPLADAREGRIARFTLAGGPFRLYGAGLYVRAVGMDLVAGAFFQTQKLDAGSKRVKWIKKVSVLCSSTTLGLDFATDYPAERIDRFANINTGGVRQWRTIRLAGDTRARLFDLKFIGPGRVYAIKVWLRVSTEQGRSEWQWITIPIDPTPDLFEWRDIPV
jgi:hypothetical protein